MSEEHKQSKIIIDYLFVINLLKSKKHENILIALKHIKNNPNNFPKFNIHKLCEKYNIDYNIL